MGTQFWISQGYQLIFIEYSDVQTTVMDFLLRTPVKEISFQTDHFSVDPFQTIRFCNSMHYLLYKYPSHNGNRWFYDILNRLLVEQGIFIQGILIKISLVILCTRIRT